MIMNNIMIIVFSNIADAIAVKSNGKDDSAKPAAE